MPAIVSSLSVAVCLFLLAQPVGAENHSNDTAKVESPAACSRVDYETPDSAAMREAAESTTTATPDEASASGRSAPPIDSTNDRV